MLDSTESHCEPLAMGPAGLGAGHLSHRTPKDLQPGVLTLFVALGAFDLAPDKCMESMMSKHICAH